MATCNVTLVQCVGATTWRAFVGRPSDLSDDRENGARRPRLLCPQGVASDRSVKIELLRLTVAATKKRLSRLTSLAVRLVVD